MSRNGKPEEIRISHAEMRETVKRMGGGPLAGSGGRLEAGGPRLGRRALELGDFGKRGDGRWEMGGRGGGGQVECQSLLTSSTTNCGWCGVRGGGVSVSPGVGGWRGDFLGAGRCQSLLTSSPTILSCES